MQTFKGFEPTDNRNMMIPAAFFSALLPMIDDLNELKITLFSMWALQQREGDTPYLLHQDYTASAAPLHGLNGDALEQAIRRTVARGTLITAEVPLGDRYETLYFANSPSGQSAVARIKAGRWIPGVDNAQPVQILPERPGAFRLYEENIGALTPLIADELKDLCAEHGEQNVAEAIQVSVRAEKRSLRYIRGVLAGWKKDGKAPYQGQSRGKDHEAAGRGSESDEGKELLSGKYSDFFER